MTSTLSQPSTEAGAVPALMQLAADLYDEGFDAGAFTCCDSGSNTSAAKNQALEEFRAALASVEAPTEPAAQSEWAASTRAKTEGGKLYEIDRKLREQHQRALAVQVEAQAIRNGEATLSPTDEQILAMWRATASHVNKGDLLNGDALAFARAILALKPEPAQQAAEKCTCGRTPQNYVCRYCAKQAEPKERNPNPMGGITE